LSIVDLENSLLAVHQKWTLGLSLDTKFQRHFMWTDIIYCVFFFFFYRTKWLIYVGIFLWEKRE